MNIIILAVCEGSPRHVVHLAVHNIKCNDAHMPN